MRNMIENKIDFDLAECVVNLYHFQRLFEFQEEMNLAKTLVALA